MYLPLESDLLRTFLLVVQNGNFTRAADGAGRTQSAVSMQIKRLEDSIGEALFVRRPRGVVLTPRGDQLLPYARRVVGLLEEAGAALRTRPLDGPVRIGIPEEYGQTVLPHALAAFAERHPAVEITVRCQPSLRQVEAIERNELDLAVVFAPGRQEGTGEVLCIDPTVWAISRGHDLRDRDPVPVAVCSPASWCSEFALRSLEQHGISYRVAYTSDLSSGLKGVASSGLAIASLSRSNIPSDCRELTAADGFPQIDSSHVVLRRNSGHSSPAIEAMAGLIRDAFGATPASRSR